jgi:hypothetical protein
MGGRTQMDEPQSNSSSPPTNAIQLVPSSAAGTRDLPPPLLERLERQASEILRSLFQLGPDASRLVKTLKDGEAFHLVMDGRTADLKKAEDGLFHAWVQDGSGKFKEQALLKPAGTDPAVLSALSGLAMHAMLIELAVKIDAIHVDIRRIKEQQELQFDGELQGLLRHYSTVCQITNDVTRKTSVTQLIGDLHMKIEGTLQRLAQDLKQQPSSEKLFPAALTDDQLATTWAALRRRLLLVLQGIRTILFCYQDIGEDNAAQTAFEQFLDLLAQIDFPKATSNARLAPWNKEDPPELVWTKTQKLLVEARSRLAQTKDGKIALDITFRPELLLP